MPFVKRANTHQTHFEDLVLLGPDGLEELNDKIEGTIDTLENNSERLNLTTKIDGAPAMFCWSKYPGYPDNSIALKGFINGPQHALSSVEDINNKYPDEGRADMREMLKYGLEIAKHIPAGQAWQGDCLFTKNSKREENINGKDYITFQPNKIIYAFSEDNPGYEQIKNADFGIAFHTIYSGEDKHQSFKVDASVLDVPSNIYIMSPALNKPNDTKVFNLDKVKAQFDRLEDLEQKLLSNFEYEDLVNNRVFMGYWNTFENANLADKKAVTINENTFINDLKEYIKTKRTKEYETQVGKLKTDAGKEKAKIKYQQDIEDLQELVETNKSLLTTLVQTLNCAATLKMLLWQGFKQTHFGYNTFYRSRTKGYLPGEMEGVAMSDQDGNIVKIVDRSTFSSYNRDPDIMSGFEHPENLTTEQLSFKENYNDELVECGTQQLWEKFNRLLESEQKTAVVAFGRMNPPTIGHQKLVDTMASLATGEKAKLFLSHTQDKKKNPLSYEQKIRYAKEAFEPKIDVVESEDKTIIDVLYNLYNQGYTDIIYVGGGDRIGGKEDISNLIMRYNGQPTKDGRIVYDFNSIEFKSAGGGDEDGGREKFTYEYVKQNLDKLNLEEIASASLVRECVKHSDFELFKKLVPFEDAENLYHDVKAGLGLTESLLKEANFGEKYELEATEYLNKKYKDELPGVEFVHMGGNDNSKPDIAVQKDGQTLFYIECKELPAQAGEFALRVENGNLTFIKDINPSEEEGGKDSPADIQAKEAIVDYLNHSKDKDHIVGEYLSTGRVYMMLKDQELIDLMRNRIEVHYSHMNATWFCAPSRNDKYSFVLVNELSHLMDIKNVNIRSKVNNGKNTSAEAFADFQEYAKENGFTNLARTPYKTSSSTVYVVTFDSENDLGLTNAKQNLPLEINGTSYAITINTHPDKLPGKYMLRLANKGNIKIVAQLNKAKLTNDDELKLVNYIKSMI